MDGGEEAVEVGEGEEGRTGWVGGWVGDEGLGEAPGEVELGLGGTVQKESGDAEEVLLPHPPPFFSAAGGEGEVAGGEEGGSNEGRDEGKDL